MVGSSIAKGGDGVENQAVLSHNVPESRRDILVRHDGLGHPIDVTNTFFRRSISMMFTLGHNDMLNAISKQEVVKLVAADLAAEVREEGLGVTADAHDELDICLLRACLFAMRDKQLGTSLDADKQAVVPIATAWRNAPRSAHVKVCNLPRLEESQRGLVVNTLGQAATAALGCQAYRAGLPIGLEKPGWQISTHYITMTLELEDALEINVTKLLMNSLNVPCQRHS